MIQGLVSGGEDIGRPEEIAHIPVFNIPAGQESIVKNNLRYSALRIEKTGTHYRFPNSVSPLENFAYKQVFANNPPIQPRYVALFALQGFVDSTHYIPARFTFFSMA